MLTSPENLLASVDRLLAEAGSDKSRLLMVTIYLAEMADYDAMNVVWDGWVPAGHTPTRACVQAKLANPEYRVEIALTAAVAQI
jgi:enamine deaminase RidA (YjgF/YER057c/UK114 family)